MNKFNRQITLKQYNSVLDEAIRLELGMTRLEGVLNDTFIIDNNEHLLSVKGFKNRGFIVLYPKFETSWTNTFHILLTDDNEYINRLLIDVDK